MDKFMGCRDYAGIAISAWILIWKCLGNSQLKKLKNKVSEYPMSAKIREEYKQEIHMYINKEEKFLQGPWQLEFYWKQLDPWLHVQ